MTPTSTVFDITKEKFRIVIPESDPAVTNLGLFVWVSPSDSPKIAHDLETVLARYHLIFIGAYKAGNNRDPFDRFRLAVDASFNARQRFSIDPKRVYVAGFSGGGRISSMLAVTYPDIFTGAIPICGVNFYTDIPAGEGQYYRRSYIPATREALLARKNGRFALITGENDVNRENTRAVYEYGFKKYGFAHSLYLEVPKMSHSNPPDDWLEKAVQFLIAEN
jgi:pimeloyl-ACP methyl ester carboxylesterase